MSRGIRIGVAATAAALATAPAASAAGVHVHAAFGARSYRVGQTAGLHIFDSPSRMLVLDVFNGASLHSRNLTHVAVRSTRTLTLHGKRPWTVYIRFGKWQ